MVTCLKPKCCLYVLHIIYLLKTYWIACAMQRSENIHTSQTSASHIHQDVLKTIKVVRHLHHIFIKTFPECLHFKHFRMFYEILFQIFRANLMPKHLYFMDVAEHRRRIRDGSLGQLITAM